MDLNFDNPNLLGAMWAIPLLGFVLWQAFRNQSARLNLYGGGRLQDLLSHKFSRSQNICKAALFLTAVLLLIGAASRPKWDFEWQEVPTGGNDLMVVLDLSSSMLANDIQPSRLERAKREIIDLLNMLEGDRLGLVAFAGIPFVQCPLTSDYRMAEIFVRNLDTSLMPVQGTDLGAAIRKTVEALEKGSEADSEGQAMILITDGEDQNGQGLAEARKAKEKGIKIFVIGIGQLEGAPIPVPGGGFKKDRQGNMVISKLDEPSLEKIALETGGTYVRSTTGDFDLDIIYHQGIRKQLTDQSRGELRQKIWYERFQWFLLPAILLLMAELLVSGYRPKSVDEDAPLRPSTQTGASHDQ